MFPRYNTCPECEEDTFRVEEEPIDRGEAQTRFLLAMHKHQKHLMLRATYEKFETYYADREVKAFNDGVDDFLATILNAPNAEKVR